MADQNSTLPWSRSGWLEQAGAWIHAELERLGLSAAGPIEQPHVRPWSTVLRVPLGEGQVYFKATAPALGHEPALTQALSAWRPDCMPQVLAANLEHGWLLLSDGGATLRSLIQSVEDIHHWRSVLPLYAGLQIEMSTRLPELLSLGALDRRLETLPAQFEQLLAGAQALHIDEPGGLTSAEYRRLQDLVPCFAEQCAQLAAYGIPETLHHDDFHDANIFFRDGRYIFFDWGESCAAHPFFTLVVTLRSVAYRLELEPDDPELARLRGIYLEPWADYAPPQALSSAFDLARRVGTVSRALTWHRVVSNLEEPFTSQHAGAVPGWLQEYLL